VSVDEVGRGLRWTTNVVRWEFVLTDGQKYLAKDNMDNDDEKEVAEIAEAYLIRHVHATILMYIALLLRT
jgi:hypothetical protein